MTIRTLQTRARIFGDVILRKAKLPFRVFKFMSTFAAKCWLHGYRAGRRDLKKKHASHK